MPPSDQPDAAKLAEALERYRATQKTDYLPDVYPTPGENRGRHVTNAQFRYLEDLETLAAALAARPPGDDGESADVLVHGMNCSGGHDDIDCTCGLRWRIMLATEQTMHRAWRKRAEEAEAEITKWQTSGIVFKEWTCAFPGKMGLSWKRAWDGVGTKQEAESHARRNCNVIVLPVDLFDRMKEHERRMVEAERLLSSPPETP